MANKNLGKILKKLQDADEDQQDIEALSDEELEEIAGGEDINLGCPNNNSCGPNGGCGGGPG